MPELNDAHPPKAFVRRKDGISAVWLVPIIALLFGGWLIVKAYLEQGAFITVQFDNAKGIIVGKTEVRYKGITTGVVKDVEVSEDLQSVIVEIEMVANASKMLTDKTIFWYVTADVSFQGISGLETLFSGSYINIQPDIHAEGKPQRHFIAVKDPPLSDQSAAGLHLTLVADTLGSLAKDSPVTYKQITVGHVYGFKYAKDNTKVEIGVYIDPEYAHLVKQQAHFWNASGIQITGSITSGLSIKSESIASVISGGIAFDYPTTTDDAVAAYHGQQFTLYRDFQSAKMGYEIELELNNDTNIDLGTAIRYQGLTVGNLVAIKHLESEQQNIIVQARINPRLRPYLTTESQFFLVKPKLSLTDNNNTTGLLTGPYIGLRPASGGTIINRFPLFSQQPAYPYTAPGLHLVLTTNQASAIKVGAAIFYQQQKVGTVQAIEFSDANQSLVHIHIQPAFQQLVTSNSRFWQISGIEFSASLAGIKVDAQPLQTLLEGGIAFSHGDGKQAIQNGDSFPLALNQAQAMQSSHFILYSEQLHGISAGMHLISDSQKIGQVHQVDATEHGYRLTVGILSEHADILRENTRFSLINPRMSLATLSDLSQLIAGQYILVNKGDGNKATKFPLASKPSAKHTSAEGLQLQLTATESYGLLPGSEISYKGIRVGQVDTLTLEPANDQVALTITIAEQYAELINHYTRFFNVSGVSVNGSLSRFSVQTNSLDSLLKGGLSFYTPEQFKQQPPADEGQSFSLFANRQQAQTAGIAIAIHFNNAEGLTAETPIKYQGLTIGRIERILLDQQGLGATVYGYLASRYHRFSLAGTKFWHQSPKLSLVNPAKLNQLLAGDYIQALPGNGKQQSHFNALDFPPAISTLSYGLNLTLSAKQLGSIKVGNPVMYRQVKVGRVIGVDLSAHADRVNIYINIAERYASLVTEHSKFWNVSGFELEAGLFSGIELNAESIESILSGGIAFATPDATPTPPIRTGIRSFNLHQSPKNDWLHWTPKIQLK